MKTYDVIVLGIGGVGSAALFQLARRGVSVLGIDRFTPGHDRGSSHGESRIIRQAYFEHPDYVPLLRRTYTLWQELEERAQSQLYFPVGLLEIGPATGTVVPGVLESARKYAVEVEQLAEQEVTQRFPGFKLPPNCQAVFEPQAGYLLVEPAVQAQARLAQEDGAQLHAGEGVLSWRVVGNGVEVVTDCDTYSAGCLVVSTGAWSTSLLQGLGVRLRVLRKHLYWYAIAGSHVGRPAEVPAFLYEMPQGVFYGVPGVQPAEIKVGEHSGGSEVLDPLSDTRAEDECDRQRVDTFVAACLRGVSNRITRRSVCFYTMSPDEHFIVDRLPTAPQVVFAAGLSGHGFKFTPVLGEILADLVLDGKTTQPIDFLRLDRLAGLG
jgi:sarcosine oxidase